MLNTRSESETPRLLPSTHLSLHLLKGYHVNLRTHSRISTSTRFSPPILPHTHAFSHHLIAISASSSPLPPTLIKSLIDVNAFIVCRFNRPLHCSHSSFYKSRYVPQHPSFNFCIRFLCSTPNFFNTRHDSLFALIAPPSCLTATPVILFPHQPLNPHVQDNNPFQFPRTNQFPRMNQSKKLSKERQGSPSLALAHHHRTNTNTTPCTQHHIHTTQIITPPHSTLIDHHSATTAPLLAWITMTSSNTSSSSSLPVPMPPLPITSASTSWRLSQVNRKLICVPHELRPKHQGSLIPMPPLPSTSASTSWRLSQVNRVLICVSHDLRPQHHGSFILMPPLPSTSASTSWRLYQVNRNLISVPHDLRPKHHGSLILMPPLPSTSALTSWRPLHFNEFWVYVPHIDISFPFVFTNNPTSHHEHTHAHNHITITPTTPPLPPRPNRRRSQHRA